MYSLNSDNHDRIHPEKMKTTMFNGGLGVSFKNPRSLVVIGLISFDGKRGMDFFSLSETFTV